MKERSIKTDLGPRNRQPIIHPSFLQIPFPHKKKKKISLNSIDAERRAFHQQSAKTIKMNADGALPLIMQRTHDVKQMN